MIKLLDVCCGQGGAARGYADAGFDVTGVDIVDQPRYPYRFLRADALDVLADDDFMSGFDAVHASFPCQEWSPLHALAPGKSYPKLIEPGRQLLNRWGGAWVIENVMTAPLDKARSIVLCGEMFGLRTIRHRRFEPSPDLDLIAPPHLLPHRKPTATSRRRERWEQGWHVSITGDVGTYLGPEAMGIDWMTGNGLCEAIPPAYTRWVGGQLDRAIRLQLAAA